MLGSDLDAINEAGIPIVVLDYNAQTLDKHIKSTEIHWSIDGAERSCCENGERIQRHRRTYSNDG